MWEEPEREGTNKNKFTIFCNLFMKVTSRHLCSTLFIKKRKSLGPAHTPGKGLYKGLRVRRWGIFRTRSEAAYRSMFWLQLASMFCLKHVSERNVFNSSILSEKVLNHTISKILSKLRQIN